MSETLKFFGAGHGASRPHRFYLGYGWVEDNDMDRFEEPYPSRWCVWFASRRRRTRWLFRGPYRWENSQEADPDSPGLTDGPDVSYLTTTIICPGSGRPIQWNTPDPATCRACGSEVMTEFLDADVEEHWVAERHRAVKP